MGGEKMYEKIQKLMDENKMTSYQLSQATGIAASSLSDWKSGRSKPKLDKLLKLSKYFNVPLEYFVEE